LEILEEAETQACHLEVVHAPGTLMIEQGTDGLSRGIWLSPSRQSKEVNQRLFEPVPYSKELSDWASLQLPCQPSLQHLELHSMSSPYQAWAGVSLWTPPPKCARQTIVAFLHVKGVKGMSGTVFKRGIYRYISAGNRTSVTPLSSDLYTHAPLLQCSYALYCSTPCYGAPQFGPVIELPPIFLAK